MASESAAPQPEFEVGFQTSVGRVREHNEDSIKVDNQLSLFAVADGMGGHLAGERASALAVDVLHEQISAADGHVDGPTMGEAVERANHAIFQESVEKPHRRGMGTTLTALTLTTTDYCIGHVGDSRAWLIRDGVGMQITQDHSVVWEQMRAGLITAEQAERHPMRNVLTRSIGNMPEVEVDVLTGECYRGDVWVLGSDGMTRALDQGRITEIVQTTASPQEAADRMVEIADTEDGSDKVSVIVVRCD